MHIRELPNYNPAQPEKAHADEKCFGILELDMWTENSAGAREVHRFQVVDFLRGSQRLREVRDLVADGVYSQLEQHPPMRVIVLLEHSVGEAMEMADAARDRKKVRDTLKFRPPTDLVGELIQQSEIKQLLLRRASHFGPISTGRTSGTQRN
jgi:hypothetical protein